MFVDDTFHMHKEQNLKHLRGTFSSGTSLNPVSS